MLLALLAVAAAMPRFGQRENDVSVLSDSDYYLDMARVFAGEQQAFDPVWSSPDYSDAHHYGCPFLPFLAGWTARAMPGIGLREAFSVVNVLAAWALAGALYLLLVQVASGLRYPWLPSALFLTGFPQVNWGYHLLTDTLGYATAFLAALAAWAALAWDRRGPPPPGQRLIALAGVFALASLAFLARETGWIVPVIVAWLVCSGGYRGGRRFGLAVLAAALAATLPRSLYLTLQGARSIVIPFSPDVWLDPGYVLDFVVKSAVAFNFAWILAVLGMRSGGLRKAPDLLVAWSVAALAYMAAGYAHNSLAAIGYPLRLTYALFPLVFFLTARGLETTITGSRIRLAALLLVVLNGAVALTGTRLDSGRTGITVPRLIRPGEPPAR